MSCAWVHLKTNSLLPGKGSLAVCSRKMFTLKYAIVLTTNIIYIQGNYYGFFLFLKWATVELCFLVLFQNDYDFTILKYSCFDT